VPQKSSPVKRQSLTSRLITLYLFMTFLRNSSLEMVLREEKEICYTKMSEEETHEFVLCGEM